MPHFKRIGALWQREGKNGKFLSGFLDNGIHGEDIPIAIFRVTDKQHEKSPDYVIALVPPRSRTRDTSSPTIDDDIPLPE